MKFQALIFRLVLTASPLVLALDYGKLAGSVDNEKAADSID